MPPSRTSLQILAISITALSFFTYIFNSHSSPTRPNIHQQLSVLYSLQQHNAQPASFHTHHTVIPSPLIDGEDDAPAIRDVVNQTLGFQKIYAISMPHRTDKRDYLALMGYISDLQIEFMDGVNASEMHMKSLPSFWKGTPSAGDHGVWRAHLNIYQHMLVHRISTALILEDDADWDLLLRYQLLDFSRGARAIQNISSSSSSTTLHSPYGDNWDLLALGHIGANNKPNKVQKYWITHDDKTVIPESKRTWSRKPDLSAPAFLPPSQTSNNKSESAQYNTRIVMEISKFTGAAAYAVSLNGAAKLLHDQALLPNAQAIDVAMLALCRHDAPSNPFLCIGAYPMLFGRYRAIGPETKDSDRRSSSNEVLPGSGGLQEVRERTEAKSEFLVWPVSLNLGGLLRGVGRFRAGGGGEGEDIGEEIDVRDEVVVFPRGREVVVRPEEYVARQGGGEGKKDV